MDKRACRYDFTKSKVHIGDKSCGWECIELHTSHNLWIRKSKTVGYFIRECFPVNSVPNKNANYEVILK